MNKNNSAHNMVIFSKRWFWRSSHQAKQGKITSLESGTLIPFESFSLRLQMKDASNMFLIFVTIFTVELL